MLNLIESDHTNYDVCKRCGGNCCQTFPGSFFPEDLTNTEAIEGLLSGDFAIDSWEGDAEGLDPEIKRTFFIRPATKGNEGKLFDYSWGGPCTFHSKQDGCRLPFNKRPRECQVLMPQSDNYPYDCKTPYTGKKDAAVAWKKRIADIINTVIKEKGE